MTHSSTTIHFFLLSTLLSRPTMRFAGMGTLVPSFSADCPWRTAAGKEGCMSGCMMLRMDLPLPTSQHC